jgi:hypothetical protein
MADPTKPRKGVFHNGKIVMEETNPLLYKALVRGKELLCKHVYDDHSHGYCYKCGLRCKEDVKVSELKPIYFLEPLKALEVKK